MSNNNVVVEEHDALMYHHHHSYPCPAYYVQSPSATTLTQNDAESSTFQSPVRPVSNPNHDALYRYSSSSRGSVHCYHHHKKVSYDESHGTAPTETEGDMNRLIIMGRNNGGDEEENDDDDVYHYDWRKDKGWMRYWTYRNTDPWAWIWIQISWRLLVSLGVALLVFYIATKPPPPVISIEVGKVREFKLGEGVDRSGVSTKILNCNCSINLGVLNKSKFFRLHIHPPLIHMSFTILPFALSHGREVYAESGTTIYEVEVGVKNKVMYGAGREMQDLLDSRRGLPILIGVSVSSSYTIVPNLIKPKFHHHLQCLLLLHKHYDKKHRTQLFNSSCKLFTSHS